MGQSESTSTDDVREILINALQVELVSLKVAVSFWRQWTEYVADYLNTAGTNLNTIRNSDANMKQVLLETVDASRKTARLMTELPKKAAQDFLRELESLAGHEGVAARASVKRRARAKP